MAAAEGIGVCVIVGRANNVLVGCAVGVRVGKSVCVACGTGVTRLDAQAASSSDSTIVMTE